jgi:hypothetical protein
MTQEAEVELSGWGRMLERHWRNHRPQLVAEYETEGTLYQALKDHELLAEARYKRLLRQGLDHQQATELVEADLLAIPPDENESETGYGTAFE